MVASLLVHVARKLHYIQGGIHYGSTTQHAGSKHKQNAGTER